MRDRQMREPELLGPIIEAHPTLPQNCRKRRNMERAIDSLLMEDFYDQRALTVVDPDSEGEERFLTVAMDARRVLVTSFTFRGDAIRIISSRKASPGECRDYDESL